MSSRRTYWISALFALAVLAISGATAWADASLVGWWPLNEGTGTVAGDASGNGRDGTFQGDPEWVAGWFGGALFFDGDDYVDTGFTDNLANWTVSCWVKSPAAPAAANPSGAVHREANFQINWNHSDVKFRAAVGLKAGTTWHGANFGTLEADTWYHLAGTYDGEDLKAYTNGRLITTNSAPSGPAANETNSLKLGKHAKSAQFFTGTVDDARVYNAALSQKEIQRIMNGYSLEPVAWYKFDETSGATAADSAGGNNGTLLPPDPNGAGLGPKWVAGKFDGGIEFDGGAGNVATNDHVDLPIGSLISKLSSATITLWANWSGTGGGWQRMFDFGSGTTTYMFLTPSRSGTNSGRFAITNAGGGGESIAAMTAVFPTGWHHVAIAIDSKTMTMQLYIDGALVRNVATARLPKDLGVTTQNWLARSQYPDSYYKGALDDFRIYDRALAADEVVNVVAGGLGFGVANTPVPAEKATDVLRDQKLSWKAGLGIEVSAHDVYFGTVRDDVANASSVDPLGVVFSPGQTATTFDPGRLEFGKTYYWRVDEVGPAPDFTVVKGNVWTFTVEPLAYTIAKASITPTASSSAAGMGPEKTIDGSGLVNDQHSTLETDMWLSSDTGEQPTWIQFAFDKVYSLNTMLVWNSNQAMETTIGYGAMGVTVAYSVDAENWTTLGDLEFAQATGEPNYVANTTVDFGGAAAKFVKLTINSNWGGIFEQFGLSEVRFSRFPPTAINPTPAPGAYELVGPVTLTWRPGRDVASHEVHLGTDKDNLPLVATVAQPSYQAAVEQGKFYYWQIVEVNEAKVPARWPSEVWTFETKATTPQDPGATGLAALYAMEDNLDDSAGSGLNGTLTNGPVFVDGNAGMGKALSFDGTDDYATLPIGDLLSTLSDITVATWTDFSQSGGGWQRVWDFGTGNNNYMFLTPAQGGTGPLTFAIRSVTVAEKRFTAPARLATGWHHVAVTINSATMTARLYFDGAIVSSSSVAVLPKDLGVTTQNWIGKSQFGSDAYYKGSVDDFRIYNQALSQSEIMYLAGQR